MTDEESRESLSFRLERGLRDAADLVSWIRYELGNGRLEHNENFRMEVTPLKSETMEAADEIYSLLSSWVGTWAAVLSLQPPRGAGAGWRRVGPYGYSEDVDGFHAGVSPLDAHTAVWRLSSWLVEYQSRILQVQPLGDEYAAEMTDALSAAYKKFPRRMSRQKPTLERRPCPICSEREVVVSWWEVLPRVWCMHCGAETDELRAELGLKRATLARFIRAFSEDADVRVEECPDCGRTAVRGVGIPHGAECRYGKGTK